jgi:hypothetical protein
MAPSAHVTSLQALEQFQVALCRFAAAAQNVLAGADAELRRAADWLEQQTRQWRAEVLKREELLVRAKGQLSVRRWTAGKGQGCTEQELAVARAQEALRHAEQKRDACRRWANVLPREQEECRAPAWRLGCALEADLPQAVAFLKQKLAALEAYTEG